MMADNVISLNSWKSRLSEGDRGIKKTVSNLMIFLRHHPRLGDNIRWNELAYRVEFNGKPMEDTDLIDIRLMMEEHRFEPRVQDLLPAIQRFARENSYHPARQFLEGLKWDGKPRLDQWLQRALGAEDTPFNRIVGRRTLIAACARAYRPGCKVDTVLVIEGPQGLKKSTAIAELFGRDLTKESVSLFDQHNKMVMAMMGAWCVELAEFVAFFRKDNASVKGLISMQTDKVVLPYAKIASEHPRQCIFFGTINPDDMGYLTDATGNRRYWIVRATRIDTETIRLHREQIWAEAVTAFKAGERWWLEGEEEELATIQAAAREESHPWDELLADKMTGQTQVTIVEALRAIGVPTDRMDKKAQNQAASSLRKCGFVLKFPKINGKTVRKWMRE